MANEAATKSVINYMGLLKQPIDATGFCYAGEGSWKSGSDIDFICEYNKKAYLIYEIKKAGVSMPDGQRWMLERLANDLKNAGKKCVVMLLEHQVYDPQVAIMLKDCQLVRYFVGGKDGWKEHKRPVNALKAAQCFIREIEK